MEREHLERMERQQHHDALERERFDARERGHDLISREHIEARKPSSPPQELALLLQSRVERSYIDLGLMGAPCIAVPLVFWRPHAMHKAGRCTGNYQTLTPPPPESPRKLPAPSEVIGCVLKVIEPEFGFPEACNFGFGIQERVVLGLR
ncbi:hypothetical protein DFJ58DRAFT_745042 [Suillus subalutaceus]|uniref:uncharacterized protein n=1 Tax=Suillus subalutaceus TaxID=48586 RepID=UPI001B85EE0C|nr:uncharacterized protein DFJ58DRAFT_745042 [Suillus subalutaceus]KAG1857319.1 hypothetical protein DFJ58DRAFT_745042 [Suillus subalutaceus]